MIAAPALVASPLPHVNTSIDNVPEELRAIDRWLCWSFVPSAPGHSKLRKVPRSPRTGRSEGWQHTEAWSDFETAKRGISPTVGVGLHFSPDDDLICLDVDHCFNSETDDGWLPDPWLSGLINLVDGANTYMERSPSGRGLHIWLRATMPAGWTKQAITFRDRKIEIYSAGSWVTVTGDDYFCRATILRNQRAIDLLLEYADHTPASLSTEKEQESDWLPVRKSYQELDEKLRTDARYREEIARLRDGDWYGSYASQSEADLALMRHVAWYQPYDEPMDRVMRESGLYREKWDERRGTKTYGEMTIARAIASHKGEFYQPWMAQVSAPTHLIAPASTRTVQPKPLDLVWFSDVEESAIKWLWEPWIPRGMLSMLAGWGGLGKSTLLSWLLAQLSKAGRWPDGTEAPAGRGVIIQTEESPKSQIKPRLRVFGADQSRAALLPNPKDENGRERLFDLDKDMERLETTIQSNQLDLVIIDPITAYMQGRNRRSGEAVRDILTRLADMASRVNAAVVLNAHTGKPQQNTTRRAVEMVLDSVEFTNVCRAVFMLAPHPEHQTNGRQHLVLGPAKANLAPHPLPSYEYYRPIDSDLVWCGTSNVTLEAILEGKTETRTANAEVWLRAALAEGPKFKSEIDAAAGMAGITEKPLREASTALGVIKSKEQGVQRPRSVWTLPPN
jgi:uncharacterized protein YeeX (DUF496 family)